MDLVIHSKMYIATADGDREIQLCVGDITQLPPTDKVDVIFISAFPNDYATTPGSVIGALNSKLALKVRNLHKKEDLRKEFNCWISDQLPEHLPYRQLLCFEVGSRMKEGTVYDNVKEIFRAMMPIFNNENKSVITPLLCTGCQHASPQEMLRVMVSTAAAWMRMGLPLQVFKVVIYAANQQKLSQMDLYCKETFESMKSAQEKMPIVFNKYEMKADIYLINSEQDNDIVTVIQKKLKQLKSDINIISVKSLQTSPDKWQHDVCMALLSSVRVVPILTTSFLSSDECIDQYNIALCCDRRTQRHLLSPLCLDHFDIPDYMGMVQWINCKPRDDAKISKACEQLVEELSSGGGKTGQSEQSYDFFISYSHRNLDVAKQCYQMLRDKRPDMRIFFDFDEIKAGFQWQQTLYHSIDCARCFLVLCSKPYLESLVCQEEFSIALAKLTQKPQQLEMVALSLEQSLPEVISGVKLLSAFGKSQATVLQSSVQSIIDWLQTGTKTSCFVDAQETTPLTKIFSENREAIFSKCYSQEQERISLIEPLSSSGNVLKTNVVLSYSIRDETFVRLFEDCFKTHYPDLFSTMLFTKGFLKSRVPADIVVFFLSANFLRSKRETDELNFRLSQVRTQGVLIYVIILDQLPALPTYVQLIPCDTNLTDEFWRQQLNVSETDKVTSDSASASQHHVRAMTKAACDVSNLVQHQKCVPAAFTPKRVLHNVHSVSELTRTVSSNSPMKSKLAAKQGEVKPTQEVNKNERNERSKNDLNNTGAVKNDASIGSNATTTNTDNNKPNSTQPISEHKPVTTREQTRSFSCDLL